MKHERLAGTFGQVADCCNELREILLSLQDAIGRAYLNGVVIIFQRLVGGPMTHLIAPRVIGQHAVRDLEQISGRIVDRGIAAPGMKPKDDILDEIIDIGGRNAPGQIPTDRRQQLRYLKIRPAIRIVPYFRPEQQRPPPVPIGVPSSPMPFLSKGLKRQSIILTMDRQPGFCLVVP